MGMSIDETISEFEILKKNTFGYMRANQAFKKAIDTMRKYQKIEYLIENRKTYMKLHYTDEEIIEKIKQVIEWG